jgi:hypothetical protein
MAMGGREMLVVVVHAAAGWALCLVTIGVGMAVMPLTPALIVHAVGAPVYFSAVSSWYFTRYGYTTPAHTALIFTGFVVIVDFLLVAVLMLHSLAMFASPLGTWIPFLLIFASTWLTGRVVIRRRGRRSEVARGRRQPVERAG